LLQLGESNWARRLPAGEKKSNKKKKKKKKENGLISTLAEHEIKNRDVSQAEGILKAVEKFRSL